MLAALRIPCFIILHGREIILHEWRTGLTPGPGPLPPDFGYGREAMIRNADEARLRPKWYRGWCIWQKLYESER